MAARLLQVPTSSYSNLIFGSRFYLSEAHNHVELSIRSSDTFNSFRRQIKWWQTPAHPIHLRDYWRFIDVLLTYFLTWCLLKRRFCKEIKIINPTLTFGR